MVDDYRNTREKLFCDYKNFNALRVVPPLWTDNQQYKIKRTTNATWRILERYSVPFSIFKYVTYVVLGHKDHRNKYFRKYGI